MKANNLDFTIAIPTYNGSDRLPRLLASLQQQVDADKLGWEIIIVDNHSQDRTAALIKEYQNNWQHPFALRYCLEIEQGAAFARLRAAREAKGELIGFLDDDNIPDADWLISAYKFAQAYPQAGAFSGIIRGEYEAEPPANFARIEGMLAIRNYSDRPQKFQPEKLRLPPAAAVVVRRQAWLESVPARPVLVGRVGGKMLGGEDYEALLHLHKAGWEIWHNPAMQTAHRIPRWRLERDYLLAIAFNSGLPACYLRTILAKDWQKPLIVSRTILGSLRRMVLLWWQYKGRIKSDLIAACEWQFFWGSLLSAFYFFQITFSRHK